MVLVCECCQEEIGVGMKPYTVDLDSYSNGVEHYDYVCNECVSAWFTECPEDIISMQVSE